ncbi:MULTISPECIES: proline dehydrogenase family protein [unclassified Herbaspirillum]|uniref:proline dehydrogenase family protein n=1 Tax=unclassified Herbaspirillum TaxID=2624150 RepID=UPI000E2E6A1D|nr:MULTISPECIES: proline dehydrogenase family protein [unclassified Herbaspirillum]RFB71161.1 L-proline dehydrogenase [Herbaspirillum sp. 3R-3a1]TFI08310.1 L-proline dehydrogenase [Herbaspirillum sp. 3R11]TFI14725.1 L-proline dehydrogenase [Herbaspirillum sp. 3R-11]TFI31883.1 L-proline dehydrogenase [Herbaspirillum sp. 3C11]TFI32034.1 L-proline dehydrogenase [Herbaspirillum sp. 3C11]
MQIINQLMAHAIALVPRPLVRQLSRRYIAGQSLPEALIRVRELNAIGCAVTLDVLGEDISSITEARKTAMQYLEVLTAIRQNGLSANLSVKPSAIGLLVDAKECARLSAEIVTSAESVENFVCFDMEDITCTQLEIELFKHLARTHGNVGLALQAYLKRTYQDVAELARPDSSLRICKGIYAEDEQHLIPNARKDRTAINEHFLAHVAHCFEMNAFVSVATHDEALILQIISLVKKKFIDKKQFEFQMLLGVCEPLRDKLLGAGFHVRIYVPFGPDWYGYSVRRLKENPEIAGYLAKALIGR